MAALRLRYVGVMSDPNFGVGDPELFSSLDAARVTMNERYQQGWNGADRITVAGQTEAFEIGVLTPEVKLELWPLLETVDIADVMPERMRKHVELIVETPVRYLIALGGRQKAKITKPQEPVSGDSTTPDEPEPRNVPETLREQHTPLF